MGGSLFPRTAGRGAEYRGAEYRGLPVRRPSNFRGPRTSVN